MARCKHCGTEIPEGLDYCDKCADKLNTAKDSESYLDSLLNAVMTEEPERREIAFQKKEASSPVSMSEKAKPKEEPKKAEEPVPVKEPEVSFTEEFSFSAEDALPDLKDYSIFDDSDEIEIDRMLEEDLQAEEAEPEEESFFDFAEEEPVEADAFSDFADFFTGGEPMPETLEEAMPELFENDEPEEILGDAEAETEATDFMDLFGGEEPAEEPTEATDFMDLFGEEEPVQADAGLDALFSGLDEITEAQSPVREEEEPETVGTDASSDFADLFEDLGTDGMDLFEFGAEPEMLDDFSETSLNGNGTIQEPKAVGKISESSKATAEAEKNKKEKKQSGFAALFHKLFDNVKVDPSKIKPQPTKEEIEAKKQAEKEAKEKSKEEKEALLAEKKAQEKQAKAEKRRLVLEAKAEKKARKLEEAKLLLEEMESTRINRAGASIVFIFFAMIAVVIVVGTSIFSYSLSIRNAQYEFDRDEYTLAYNEIFGLDIKDEDIVLYDRIMTVMYVQKQLNSYYNYYEMKDYPKALDSLLKGLQRYEKYIELAVELEIESDLDSVRSGILDELGASFSMSEQEAMNIIQADSQLEYSMLVYDAVDELEIESDTIEE